MLIAQVNLGLQIAILAIIFIGYILKRRGNFFLHGTLMLVGVVLNIVSFLVVMGPSLLSFEIIRTQPLHEYSLITLTHGIVGGVALVMGVVIVALWHFQSSTKDCIKRKRLMKPTIVLWTTALILGIYLYTILYG
jgi:uncharacterized membrane protein YozB (DUF420 family)